MKFAVISDIHSNLEALADVLNHIDSSSPDRIICCGDVVGYGPQPAECVSLLESVKGITMTEGNHDAAVTGNMGTRNFNDFARTAVKINKSLLGPAEKFFLKDIPETHTERGLLFVHASPRDHLSEYLDTVQKMKENAAVMTSDICFVGHTHFPMVFSVSKHGGVGTAERVPNNGIFMLRPDKNRYIINVGSVGQPRDGDARSSFVYFDDEANSVTYIRLKYDVASVQKKMRDAGLPELLITRLALGR